MVGAAVIAENNGPSSVFVGIDAPTKRTWDGDTGSVRWYGEWTGHQFLDDNKKQALAAAVGLAAPKDNWWVNRDWLRDTDGQDISDWTTIETLKRLNDKSDELAKQIADKVEAFARKVDDTLR